MNKNVLLFIVIICFFIFRFLNQKSEKPERVKKQAETTEVNRLIKIVKSYKGSPYKEGGITKKGMDCSGLVNTSFNQIDIKLPRSSNAISKKGKEVNLKDVKQGDLLFFDIARLKGGINHVGLVTLIKNGEIFFIHSTTSKGVIISSMKQTYWKNEFVVAKRIL